MTRPDDDLDEEATLSISRADLLKNFPAERRRLVATLTVIAGKSAGRVYRLESEETILGRSNNATIVIEDEGVSRRHARITETGGSHVLSDLGSRNGTILNGTLITEPTVLHDGDRIRIGTSTVFKFGYQDELEESLQSRLYDSATRDPLTRAYNRQYFTERLASEWAWAKRHRTSCALIALDADRFKHINDTYGHPAGDFVLRELVTTIQRVIRKEDLLARIGGEEFIVLARATDRHQGALLAERIRAAVEAHPFVHNGTRLPVTISLGVATSDDPGVSSPDDLIAHADQCLYRAKEKGRNRVEPAPVQVR